MKKASFIVTFADQFIEHAAASLEYQTHTFSGRHSRVTQITCEFCADTHLLVFRSLPRALTSLLAYGAAHYHVQANPSPLEPAAEMNWSW